MKIVVDTNVLISATFWSGASSKIIQKAENRELELISSMDIIDEYYGVLNYKEIQDKIRDKNLEMKETVGKVISVAAVVWPKEKLCVIKDDTDDDKIVECAVEGEVDYIVSQDNHLLRLKEFRGIKILSPIEFLKRL